MKTPHQLIKLDLCFLFWLGVVIIGHITTLNAPFVNLEYAFSEAAHTLAEPSYTDGIQRYWATQANPLGYSLITAGLLRVLDVTPSFWFVRLPSLFGAVLILTSGWAFYRHTHSPAVSSFGLWAAATMLNPLCWIYTGQATSDVLSTGLICGAFLVCFGAKGRLFWHFIGGLLFSLSVIVKFNTALLGLGFVYLTFCEQEKNYSSSLLKKLSPLVFYTLLPAVTIGIYFIWIYSTFQIYLLSDQFRTLYSPSQFAGRFLEIITMYLSYLVALLGFMALTPLLSVYQAFPKKKALAITLFGVILTGILSPLIISFNIGEMDYGGFNHLLPSGLFAMMRLCALFLSIFLVVDLLQSAICQKNRFAAFVLSAMLPYLTISSFFRPTQRYLLLVLPMVFFYLTVYPSSVLRRVNEWLGWASVVVFAIVSFVGVSYLVAEGEAAENMAQWIKHKNYLEKTNPGTIVAHVGHYFPVREANSYSFIVQTEPPASYLHKETLRVFGKEVRTYYLCEMKNCVR